MIQIVQPPTLDPVNPDAFADDLFTWLTDRGASHYDPGVTQLEHALQTAELAAAKNGDDTLVVAALLHDVGHLLVGEHTAQLDFLDRDLRHERVGANWLQLVFPPAVSEPVRWHVDAKRYLCAVDLDYWEGLSAASKRSLMIQGGPMSPDEIRQFERAPWAQNAIKLRKIDDKAKIPNRQTPPLTSWRPQILSLMQ